MLSTAPRTPDGGWRRSPGPGREDRRRAGTRSTNAWSSYPWIRSRRWIESSRAIRRASLIDPGPARLYPHERVILDLDFIPASGRSDATVFTYMALTLFDNLPPVQGVVDDMALPDGTTGTETITPPMPRTPGHGPTLPPLPIDPLQVASVASSRRGSRPRRIARHEPRHPALVGDGA